MDSKFLRINFIVCRRRRLANGRRFYALSLHRFLTGMRVAALPYGLWMFIFYEEEHIDSLVFYRGVVRIPMVEVSVSNTPYIPCGSWAGSQR